MPKFRFEQPLEQADRARIPYEPGAATWRWLLREVEDLDREHLIQLRELLDTLIANKTR